ncbi:helix-turn-helix domain-containing protein [Enterococcus larvae]|uniref:helix-turn-helix domain-containing protein n=1 Tax=Enterococcus larvae TaxID=2794352 RepID=UPI003F2FC5B1
MSPNDLLMEEERYQLYMLQILEARKSTFCSVDQICEILELSKYKAEKNLEALQDTLLLVEEKSSITVEPTGEIHLSGITNLLLKKMRLYYLEKSPYFFMFHSFITKEMGVETQLEQLPVSRSLAYKYQKYVKKLLSEENFKLNKNQVIGSEFRLRSFVFGFYYDVFNGISNPFSVEISKMTKEIIDFLVNYQNVSIPKTKEHKLTFFINVWLTRISHGHLVKEE